MHLTSMKRKLLILFCVLVPACLFSIAQVKSPIKKIYAYKQGSISGIIPLNPDKPGNTAEKEHEPRFNYWFYTEVFKTEKISITDLWIGGKRFSVKNEPITVTPVKKIIDTGANGPDTVILVPKTHNKIILTYPSGLLKDIPGSSRFLSNLISRSELVIGYLWKGKKYFTGVKALKKLQPDVYQ